MALDVMGHVGADQPLGECCSDDPDFHSYRHANIRMNRPSATLLFVVGDKLFGGCEGGVDLLTGMKTRPFVDYNSLSD